jgi:hypothetical protein
MAIYSHSSHIPNDALCQTGYVIHTLVVKDRQEAYVSSNQNHWMREIRERAGDDKGRDR